MANLRQGLSNGFDIGVALQERLDSGLLVGEEEEEEIPPEMKVDWVEYGILCHPSNIPRFRLLLLNYLVLVLPVPF